MKRFTTVVLGAVTVCGLVFLVLALAAQATPEARAVARARAAADIAAAQAWATLAEERALAWTLFLWFLLCLTLLTLALLALAVVRGAWLRAETLPPDRATALYPAVRRSRGEWVVLNEERAQMVAAMPRMTAAVARALLTSPAPRPENKEEPAALPARASIYDALDLPTPSLPVGEGERGRIVLPLHNLGNVLIGGLPGMGKSELLASMLVAALHQARRGLPVCAAVIDTKRVDFGNVRGVRGLWAPVATTTEEARDLLAAAQNELERRFRLLQEANARSLRDYPYPHRLPYLLLLVDELADWAGDEGFNAIALAIGRKGRAAGISLILATQRPSSDVVNTSLRAMTGVQIAFRVRSAHDSRAILGASGAEALPQWPGRCLVARGDIVQAQAFMAGLAEGHFDRFLRGLPAAPTLPPPVGEGVARGAAETAPTPTPPVARIIGSRRPTAAEAEEMRRLYREGWSLNRLCEHFWGYKDQTVLGYVREAVGYERQR